MTVKLLSGGGWPAITAAADGAKRPAYVAVAYFGQGGAGLLPLSPGSRLVVDASEGAVKSGQTCPSELEKLLNNDVRVYSVEDLHAKVYVLGNTCFVGSANVSNHSANNLIEAMLVTTEPAVVTAARDFVRDLCLHELGPEAITRLGKIYEKPKFSGPRNVRKGSDNGRGKLPRTWIAYTSYETPAEEAESFRERARKAAVKKQTHPRKFLLDEFWWRGPCAYEENDVVVVINDDGNGKYMVYPPSTIVHKDVWWEGDKATNYVWFETPPERRISLSRFKKKLSREARKRLSQDGRVSRPLVGELLAAWQK